jgi:pimeloyl-ACP methyl ester carboxylesterase
VLALHADGSDPESAFALCAALGDAFHVCAPRAPRSLNPFRTGGRPGAARSAWGAYTGYAWLRRDPDGHVDPASFGDALFQVTALVDELASDGASRCTVLLGHREGAALALAAAYAAPDRAQAVVVLDPAPEALAVLSALGVPRTPAVPALELHEADLARAGAQAAAWLHERLALAQPPSSATAPAAGPRSSPQ